MSNTEDSEWLPGESKNVAYTEAAPAQSETFLKPLIAFAYMRLCTPWENGVPHCIKECKAYGLPSPQLIDFDADLRINVFRNPSHPNPPLQNRLQCRTVLKQNCLRAL